MRTDDLARELERPTDPSGGTARRLDDFETVRVNVATLRAAAARLRELSEVIRKAHRISVRHDHEITRLVDLQDLLAAQLTETSRD